MPSFAGPVVRRARVRLDGAAPHRPDGGDGVARLGLAHAVAELAAPADLTDELGGAGRGRGPHPPTGVGVVALAPVLPRQPLRLAVVGDDQLVLGVDRL